MASTESDAIQKPTTKCSLLSMLPKPKNLSLIKEKAKPVTFLKPNVIFKPNNIKKQLNNEQQPAQGMDKVQGVKRPLVAYDSDDSDYSNDEVEQQERDDNNMDFFGLDSNATDINMPSTSLTSIEANQPLSDTFIGPSKPTNLSYDNESDDGDDVKISSSTNVITEDAAKKMIYDRELAPFGVSSMAASEAVLNMIDVSVDKALGPNIQANLLKNLNNKVMAQISVGPLPTVKKDPKDRLSKQKHQITHLAGLAVAREEQLQEQWAEGRSKKRLTAKKYGF